MMVWGERMTRSEILAGACAMVAPAMRTATTTEDIESIAISTLLMWRYVVLAYPFRVGVLSSAGVAVIERDGVPPARLNLPRASPDTQGWVPAKSPVTPYVIPERHPADDLIWPAGPDEITMAAETTLGVIFGVATPPVDMPIVLMPSFLIRITLASLKMETYALPPAFESAPVAIFSNGPGLTVVNGRGKTLNIAK
jgi:hypothetical protein